jgi:hypothetical protein
MRSGAAGSETAYPITDDARNAAAAGLRPIGWCKAWRHQVEPDPAEMAEAMAASRPCRIGASGLCARSAAAAR